MKRFFFIAATILAAACTREPIIPEESVDPAEERSGRIDVTLVAGNPETRTEVFNDGSLKPYWSKDDNISVVFIDGDEFEFSAGFTELHTKSYQKILAGEGFRISEAIPCIQIVHDIRNAQPIGLVGDYHPLAKLPLAKHPFGWDDVRY